MSCQPNVRGYNDDSISYCFKHHFILFLSKQPNWKVSKVKIYEKEACKLLGTLVAKRYGCKAVGWDFKSELDLLLLILCEDNKLSWL